MLWKYMQQYNYTLGLHDGSTDIYRAQLVELSPIGMASSFNYNSIENNYIELCGHKQSLTCTTT